MLHAIDMFFCGMLAGIGLTVAMLLCGEWVISWSDKSSSERN